MDVLIYSGQELFILDGDALLQFVLDDELLGLGRAGDPSMQLLHATWLMEKTVEELLKKDTTFEIVFFESAFRFPVSHRPLKLTRRSAGQAHSTIHTGESDYITSARRLARSVLMRRANLPDTKVHHFESLQDEKWKAWYQRKRVSSIILSPPGPY